jgi:hypothetical protein
MPLEASMMCSSGPSKHLKSSAELIYDDVVFTRDEAEGMLRDIEILLALDVERHGPDPQGYRSSKIGAGSYGYAYPEFSLVRLDLVTRQQEVVPTPEVFHGCSAMTMGQQDAFFHHAYEDSSTIWRWRPGSGEPTAIGRFNGQMRGLRGGSFIAIEGKEFAIISCSTG